MAELLSPDEVDNRLRRLDGWSGDGKAIVRTVELPTFPSAIEVVNRVAEAAEAMQHHPDIDIRWTKLTFTCASHAAGGVTAADIELAHRINEVVATAVA